MILFDIQNIFWISFDRLQRVRFHGLFDDDMSVYLPWQGQTYSWFNVDSIFDYFLSLGVRPLVELRYLSLKISFVGHLMRIIFEINNIYAILVSCPKLCPAEILMFSTIRATTTLLVSTLIYTARYEFQNILEQFSYTLSLITTQSLPYVNN